jgi:hypothetical protein
MSKTSRDVIKPPNQEYRGDRRSNSYLDLAGAPAVGHGIITDGPLVQVKNAVSLTKSEPSPVKPPDHRFHVDEAVTPELTCARTPGHGAIPVEPSDSATEIVKELDFKD